MGQDGRRDRRRRHLRFCTGRAGRCGVYQPAHRGDAVTAGESFGDVESVKAVSDIISPVSGTICAVNEALADAPETLNSDPYGAWIIKVEGIGGTEELLDAAAYEAHCAEEG